MTRGVAPTAVGLQQCLYLGILGALRDWGHARAYVRRQCLMLQQVQPKHFVVKAVREWGITVRFDGEGPRETGIVDSVDDQASLYAAFNTKTGEVLGKTATRHTSAEFVPFVTDIVVNLPKGKEIHVIATTSGPTRPSRSLRFWLRTATTHIVSDLKRKLMRYIRKYNEQPKP